MRIRKQMTPFLQSDEITEADMRELANKRMVLASSKPKPMKLSSDLHGGSGLIAKEYGNIVSSPSMRAYKT